MFAALGRWMARARWSVLAAGLGLALVGAFWGTGVLDEMTSGGEFDLPGPAADARTEIAQRFGNQGADLLVLYSSRTATVDDPAFRDAVVGALRRLRARPEVAGLTSYYDTRAEFLVSQDRHATYAAVRLSGEDDDAKLVSLDAVEPVAKADGGGVRTQLGGGRVFQQEAHQQVGDDLERAEALSLPILLVLLILIFRGVVAAGTPLLIGGLAILGGLTTTRLIALFTDVSVFALNIITLIGLGMAIDYALFIVSRFREELAAGHSPAAAVERTMATAGRTVFVSGMTVLLALGSLLIFPRLLLRSLGLGGMAAVFVAMLASLTVLPALLRVLGPKINALRVPLPGRRRAERNPTASAPQRDGGWARLARSVMRRPVWYVVGVAAVLGALATPFHRVEFGGIDERILPASAQSHQVAERLANEFPGSNSMPIAVLVSPVTSPADVQAFLGQVTALSTVTGARVTAQQGTSVLISVGYTGAAGGRAARDTVTDLRRLPAPAGARVWVAGLSAELIDALDDLGNRLPWMLLIVAAVAFVLLFLAFGSVVLPIKAILMNIVSISASFGVMVWVFQDGHLHRLLGFAPTGTLDADNLVLMLAILFGLSTDYEVFLLSRIREQWDAGADNTEAVATGLQRTGGIITSAALLLMIVVGGFTTGGVLFIKMLGIGMLVAIVVDASGVRALLVPATMRLIGRWNWWAPGPLARVYRRYGIREDTQPGQPAEGH